MKTIKILSCILISLQLNSQISLENTYPASSNNVSANVVKLVKSGYKYSFYDQVNKTVKLYNMNHSIFKTMFIPVPAGYGVLQQPFLISDSLFNTDSQVEYVATFFQSNNTVTPVTYNLLGNVISENGTILLTLNQCASFSAFNTGANGYKLLAVMDSANTLKLKEHRIYSLVGALAPSVNQPVSVPNTQSDYTHALSNPVPNPSHNKTIIPYSIPEGTQSQLIIIDITGKEIKRLDIDSNFNTIELDNSELPSGTYFYSLSDTNGSKKMLVVH